MTANTLRSFAAGLIVAVAVLSAVYFYDSTEETAVSKEKLTTEEMIAILGSDGYVVHTKEQWLEQDASTEIYVPKVEGVEEVQVQEQKVEEPEVKEVIVYRTIITVSPGMTSIDVGDALARANITESAREFFNEVEKRGLANQLRPGSFEVDSNMSINEVISIIFK